MYLFLHTLVRNVYYGLGQTERWEDRDVDNLLGDLNNFLVCTQRVDILTTMSQIKLISLKSCSKAELIVSYGLNLKCPPQSYVLSVIFQTVELVGGVV